MKRELIMVIGPQAAGKTTWARQYLRKKIDWMLVSSDLYWPRCPATGLRYWCDDLGERHVWGDDPIPGRKLAEAWRYAYRQFLDGLYRHFQIVFEGTFPKPADRSAIINIATYFDYRVTGMCFYPTLATCANRNQERIDRVPDIVLARTYAAFEVPTKSEGFDYIEVL